MTVSTQVRRTTLGWTGAETSFSAGFPIDKPADLRVIYRAGGVESDLTPGVHYSAVRNPVTGLATVTPIALPPAPATLTMVRTTPALVQEQLQDGEDFPASVHQALHDRGAMRDAELRDDLSRTIRLTISSVGEDGEWDAQGRPIRNYPDPVADSDIATAGWVKARTDGAVAEATEAAARASAARDEIVNGLDGKSGQPDAEAGLLDNKVMTPLRTAQAVEANAYPTRASLVGRTLPAVMTAVRTSGYAAPGDGGGGLYRIVGAEPGHPGKIALGGGKWAELAEMVIRPEMFGAVSDGGATDSYQAIANAISAAVALGRVLRFDGQYGLASKLTVPSTLVFEAAARSRLVAFAGCADGVEFAPGNRAGEHTWPGMTGFSGVAMRIRCSLTVLIVPQFLACSGVCAQIYASGSSVLDTIVRMSGGISACGVAMEIYSDNASRVIQGCGLEYNFITNTGCVVRYSGTPCYWDGLFARGYAVDLTSAQVTGAFLDNTTATPIPRFRFEVWSWAGGDAFAPTTGDIAQIMRGKWVSGTISLSGAYPFDHRHLAENLWQSGTVSMPGTNATPRTLATTAGLANYNGGKADCSTTLSLTAVTTSAWQTVGTAGDTKDFYFYNIWADRAYDVWMISPVDLPKGVVIQQVYDESATEPGRVRIRMLNLGPALVSGQTILLTAYRSTP